jgi:hypothetical protein
MALLPAGAACPWLARRAPEAVGLHGLQQRAAPQSPRVPPACVCLPIRGTFVRCSACAADRFGAMDSLQRMSLKGRRTQPLAR